MSHNYPEAFLLTKGRVVCEECFLRSKKNEKVHLRKLLWYPEAINETCSICKRKLIKMVESLEVSSIQEVKKDDKPIRAEEIFSVLKFDGVTMWFAVSKEELLDATWVYRLYAFDQLKYRLISEQLHDRVRNIMQEAAFALNSGNELGCQIKVDELMKIWKEQWASGTADGEGNKFNVIK